MTRRFFLFFFSVYGVRGVSETAGSKRDYCSVKVSFSTYTAFVIYRIIERIPLVGLSLDIPTLPLQLTSPTEEGDFDAGSLPIPVRYQDDGADGCP